MQLMQEQIQTRSFLQIMQHSIIARDSILEGRVIRGTFCCIPKLSITRNGTAKTAMMSSCLQVNNMLACTAALLRGGRT